MIDDDYDGLNFKQSDSTSNGDFEESQLGASGAFKVKNNICIKLNNFIQFLDDSL